MAAATLRCFAERRLFDAADYMILRDGAALALMPLPLVFDYMLMLFSRFTMLIFFAFATHAATIPPLRRSLP